MHTVRLSSNALKVVLGNGLAVVVSNSIEDSNGKTENAHIQDTFTEINDSCLRIDRVWNLEEGDYRIGTDFEAAFLEGDCEPFVPAVMYRGNEEGNGSLFCGETFDAPPGLKMINAPYFSDSLYKIMGWNPDYQYICRGTYLEQGKEKIIVFDIASAISAAYVQTEEDGKRRRVLLCPDDWNGSFGEELLSLPENPRERLKEEQLRCRKRVLSKGKTANVMVDGKF